MNKGNKKVNITEIAKRANVSIATVSRAINTPEKVKKETREKIQREIEHTNYMRNALGMHLRTNKTHTIGLIHTSLEMDFYSQIAQGIEETAREHDYTVMLCNSADDPDIERRQLQMLFEKQVDGIILAPTRHNLDLIRRIQANAVPICCIDRIYPGLNSDCVQVDNSKSTYEATQQLIDVGYRHIGFISAPLDISTGRQRLDGYLDALADNHIEVDERIVKYGDAFARSGYDATIELVEDRFVDCIFCANELMALGSLEALTEKRVRIPEELGFLIWDNPHWTKFSNPQISVIAQPTYEMGAIAAETLIRRMATGQDRQEGPLKVTLHARMIERSSLQRHQY